LVAHKSITTLSQGLALDVQKCTQVLEETHLVAIVLGVVLDVTLVRSQLFNQDFLLTQLHKKGLIQSPSIYLPLR
jgi:hypothetical protein